MYCGHHGEQSEFITEQQLERAKRAVGDWAVQSGKKKIVLARYVHNDRLIDALGLQAFAALGGSAGARAYYDQQVRHEALHDRAEVRDLRRRPVAAGRLKLGAA